MLVHTNDWNIDAEKEPGNTDQEPGLDFGTIGYYIFISIPVAFTIFGLIYMCRNNRINREIRKTCCPCCIDLEKTDRNLDYGEYYDSDGERRQDVMEVTFWFPSSILINQCLLICKFQDIPKIMKYIQMQDNNPAYESGRNSNQIEDYDYM